MKRHYKIIAIVLLVAVGTYSFTLLKKKPVQSAEQATETTKVRYEIPTLHNGRPEQVIEHLGYTVSYNSDWMIANWVAYELTNFETDGEAERQSKKFQPDPQVIGARVTTQDYTHSGYDRGHLAPAADMKWDEKAMEESFYMTNICPQNHNNNAGDWKSLEEQARDWAQAFGNIYICCGPIVAANPPHIGDEHSIAVPESFYKVFLRKKGDTWATIGFVMPNAAGSRPLMTYMHTVDEVEEMTGIDFFSSLPEKVQQVVEADYTVADWTVHN